MSEWRGSAESALETAHQACLQSPELDRLVGSTLTEAAEDMIAMAEFTPQLFDVEAVSAALERLQATGRVATRNDAVLLTAYRLGTGTVLDADAATTTPRPMTEPPPEPDRLIVCPLPDEELREQFGTTTPPLNDVLENITALDSALHRHDGRYITAEGPDGPVVVFFGRSGD